MTDNEIELASQGRRLAGAILGRLVPDRGTSWSEPGEAALGYARYPRRWCSSRSGLDADSGLGGTIDSRAKGGF